MATTDSWIDSLDRALEVVEGQLALAHAVNASSVAVPAEILQKLWDAAKVAHDAAHHSVVIEQPVTAKG